MKNFSQHLERWRNESEHRRHRRALLLASGITVCLFVIWLGSFRLSSALREVPTINAAKSTEATSLVASPVAVGGTSPGIIERIKAGWRAVTQ
ncbi:MAG TPA: hypothetical protein VJB69_00165 [Candidatus Paceibacterota bacterium]